MFCYSFGIVSDNQKWLKDTSFRFKNGMFVVWFGTSPRLHVRKPQQMEVILGNSKLIQKPSAYDQLKNWLGEGLLTSNGNFATVLSRHARSNQNIFYFFEEFWYKIFSHENI